MELPLKKHPLYTTWRKMKRRCYNQSDKDYKNYGARGITVCERWRTSSRNFIDDMGMKPDGKTLDRIDNDGNYEPSNCRWATQEQQSLNKRKYKNNTSGHQGIDWSQNSYRVRYRKKYYGHYKSLEEAIEVRRSLKVANNIQP